MKGQRGKGGGGIGPEETLIVAPLSSGSHPESNMPGRRREDDENLVAGPLQTGATPKGHGQAGVNDQAAASNHIVPEDVTGFSHTQGIDAQQPFGEAWPSLRSGGHGHAVGIEAAVRRLTPVECERLQGFPDEWTNPTGEEPDSRRYAALGDAVTVNVAHWVGLRIAAAEA